MTQMTANQEGSEANTKAHRKSFKITGKAVLVREECHFKAQSRQVQVLMALFIFCVNTCVLQLVCRTTNTDEALFF
jgi:hypothetical protein